MTRRKRNLINFRLPKHLNAIEVASHSLLFVVLPVSIKLTSLVAWFLLGIWLIKPDLKGRLRRAFKNKYVWALSLPLFYMIITLIYSDEFYLGLKSIENKMFFLLFPLVLATVRFTRMKFNLILTVFTASIFFWSFICISVGFYNLLTQEVAFQNMSGDIYNRVVSRWGYISGIKLVEVIGLSPIYMSLFVGFAILICIHFYCQPESKRKRALALLIVYFLIFNLLLGARMGIISLILVLMIYAIKCSVRRTKTSRRLTGIVAASATLLILLVLTMNPLLQKRFSSDFKSYRIPQDITGWNSVNLRMAIWKCSIELSKVKPFLGYGVASPDRYREECYRQFSFYPAFGTDLNSHNQYLEYLLIGGLPLLSLLLFGLAVSYRQAIIWNSDLYKNFIIFLTLNMFTESLLNVQKGLIFYIYFSCLFLFGLRNLRSEQPSIEL